MNRQIASVNHGEGQKQSEIDDLKKQLAAKDLEISEHRRSLDEHLKVNKRAERTLMARIEDLERELKSQISEKEYSIKKHLENIKGLQDQNTDISLKKAALVRENEQK